MSESRSTVGEFAGWFLSLSRDDASLVQEMVMDAVGQQALYLRQDIALGSILSQVQAEASAAIAEREAFRRELDSYGDAD